MRHGLKKTFSCKGIALALDYFHSRGYRAVGFVPDYYLDMERGEIHTHTHTHTHTCAARKRARVIKNVPGTHMDM
jgi:hypothetical protein